ncbi:carbon-nitrogen hydrolase family protein [Nocardioides insulae]|uniref:carbon-nitrogen hydrolase family protein n=1 Tax=Nocardioides insulae TaxID=394734 RepID=UPI000406B4FC|nr:carbon-nitrogen hydrolase family protein [Nocardioides insulae]
MPLRVGAVQAVAVPGDLSANLTAAARWVGAAGERGVGLLAFPEAFVTGYDLEVLAGPLPPAEQLDWLDEVQRAVGEHHLVVVLPSPLERGDRATLSSLVLAPGRLPVAAYDKQHLDATERARFTAGERALVLEVEGVRVGISICYDASFPEHAAEAAAAGAQVYLNSGAWFPGGEHRRDLHHRARALDNGVYVVFAGLVGAPSDFIGGSAVYDPEGRLLAGLDEAVEGLVVADLDPWLVEEIRTVQRMWADRRPSAGVDRVVIDGR